MKKNAGFTLIELVAVMVILAILAVVAVPQFVDLRDEAQQASVDGVAGSLASASALNYAAEMANPAKSGTVAKCDDVRSLLQGGLSADYAITPATAIVAGDSENCTVTHTASTKNATFVAIGVN